MVIVKAHLVYCLLRFRRFGTGAARLGIAVLTALWATQGVAAAPTIEDSMAQRTLACSACHGKEGRATNDGYYPRIAGKPAGYLYHQLLNFRDGRRHYGLMTQMVDLLSDDYLREIAGHFASIDLPYPAPPPTTASPEVLRRGPAIDTARRRSAAGAGLRAMPWRGADRRGPQRAGSAGPAARLPQRAAGCVADRPAPRARARLHGADCQPAEA